jgi:hypothetical protein
MMQHNATDDQPESVLASITRDGELFVARSAELLLKHNLGLYLSAFSEDQLIALVRSALALLFAHGTGARLRFPRGAAWRPTQSRTTFVLPYARSPNLALDVSTAWTSRERAQARGLHLGDPGG